MASGALGESRDQCAPCATSEAEAANRNTLEVLACAHALRRSASQEVNVC